MNSRRFIDVPLWLRCVRTITLKDGSKAQCGRVAKIGLFCTQHARMQEQRK